MTKELFNSKMAWYCETFGKQKTIQTIHAIRYIMWENKDIRLWCDEFEKRLKQ